MKIIKYIKEYGLGKTLEDFNLKSKDYGHKIIIKYSQITSNFTHEEVREARGLILEKDTWKIMSFAFKKFFNSEESHAANIDFNNALILEKCDGSMLQLYYDWIKKEWCVGTTGTAEGEGEVNNKLNTNFNSLFWNTVKDKYNLDNNKLNKRYCYVFELCTPFNIVVKPHSESSATLLTIRDLDTLKEISFVKMAEIALELNLPFVKSYDFKMNNFGDLKKKFINMPWSEEGYVVVDNNFNRVKLKNPAYVSVHHTKGKMGNHHIMGVIKTNECDEFIATFKERENEIRELEIGYKNLLNKLTVVWDLLSNSLPKDLSKNEQKKFALLIFKLCEEYNLKNFSGLFFGLSNNKINDINDYMFNFNNKQLYNLLINKINL